MKSYKDFKGGTNIVTPMNPLIIPDNLDTIVTWLHRGNEYFTPFVVQDD